MPLPDGERLFIGDGGLETTMLFREGFELPEFASFTLLGEPAGGAGATWSSSLATCRFCPESSSSGSPCR